MYDPVIARWNVVDPLAEYAFNYTPYNYVKNNPLLYIDLFGLSDTTYIAPKPIEVVVTYTPPPKPTTPDFTSVLYSIDGLLMGNHNSWKTRDANWFERWCIRNFDMKVVSEIGEAMGNWMIDPANQNTVRTDESYQGRTEDEKIIETSAGNNKEIIESNPIIKEYKGFNWSSWEDDGSSGRIRTYTDASRDSVALIYGDIDSIKIYTPHTRRNGRLMSREITKTIK